MIDVDNLITIGLIVFSVLGSVKLYTAFEFKKARMEEDYIAQRQKERIDADIKKAQIEANVYVNDVQNQQGEGLTVEGLVKEAMAHPEMVKDIMGKIGM